ARLETEIIASLTMPNDLQNPPVAQLLPESERSAFYAWAHEQGFTRLNMSHEELAEELWFDPKGKIMSAGRIVREHPRWKPALKAAAQSAPKPAASPAASINRT